MIDGLVQRVGYWHKLLTPRSHRTAIVNQATRAAEAGEPELRLLRERAGSVDGFVDVGAAVGLYLASLLPTGLACVAFEPNPLSARLLRRTFPEVELHQVALGAEPDVGTLRIPRTRAGRQIAARGSLLDTAPAGMTIREATVPIRTLDSFDLPGGRLMLKIDVEGAELAVLAGAETTLDRVEVALIECEERHAPGAPDQLIEHMAAQGFDGWVITRGQLIPMADFRVDIHQSGELVAALTVQPDPEAISAYGNNFLFIRRH